MKKKLGNKGFSLVELIIVIAIMVVLVGVLAPQFTKYVGQSRTATDDQNADLLRTTAAACLADPLCTYAETAEQDFTVDATKPATTTNCGNFLELMEDAIGATNWPEKSDGSAFTLTISVSNGGYTVSVN